MTPEASTRRGRPRGFDLDGALDSAMLAFWQRGYDGVSIADLTAELGIGAPSLYAAFGDKKALFRSVVERYTSTHGVFVDEAMSAEPTAQRGVARALRTAARHYTRPGQPRGCLVFSAAVNCSSASADVEEYLRDRRRRNQRQLTKRITQDVTAGLLPADTPARRLSVLVGATLAGMSQQARDGASEAELRFVADAAMNAWPTVGRDPRTTQDPSPR
jgi:AcrR family transcriptional regulator